MARGGIVGFVGAALSAVLGFLLEPVVAGLVPGSSYLPRTTTIPGYFAAATLWLIGAGFLIWQRRRSTR